MLLISFITIFLIFFTIPLFARRFGKFMPMDAGTALYYMFHIYHLRISGGEKRLRIRNNLLKKLIFTSLFHALFGILLLLIFNSYEIPKSYLLLIFLCTLMANIDERYFILPDILTVPLLIIGFSCSTLNLIDIAPIQSSIGAVFGYILPTISAYLMFLIRPSKLGGGDIKLLSAIGAWLGIEGLVITICFSFIFFLGKVFLFKQKEGAYGLPAFLGILSYLVMKYILEIQNLLII